MKYPPLPDPESPTPGPAAAPPGSDPGRSPSSGSVELPAPKGAPAAEPEPSGTSAPGADTAREGRAAPPPDAGADGEADTPIYAAPQPSPDEIRDFDDDGIAGPSGDDSEDDEFAELIERVDFDELDELDDLDDDDDAVEVPTLTEAPEPAREAQPRAPHAAAPSEVDAAAMAARHRIGTDEPIPMLTEVVQVPRYDTEDLPQSLAEVDWGDLAQRVRENVLERLLRRSDALLDAQLQDTLVPVLERAAETVAHELHDALNRMIRDIVARAVTEELTRLHAEIAKRNRSRPH